ncbi:hypothetical protein KY339_00450 [Candidatus Woesearchaeota archaeon]|nr:hypothetical protein [Candidatus Woesearchaeota archaeon]
MTTYVCPKCGREDKEKGFCPKCRVLREKVCPFCGENLSSCTCTGDITETKGGKRTNFPV